MSVVNVRICPNTSNTNSAFLNTITENHERYDDGQISSGNYSDMDNVRNES